MGVWSIFMRRRMFSRFPIARCPMATRKASGWYSWKPMPAASRFVSGRAGGVVDAVVDGVNGLAVDGNDSEAIAAGLMRLLQDDALYARLAQGGLEMAQRSDWKSRAAEFLKLCE